MNRQKGDIIYDLFIVALIAVVIAQTCKPSTQTPETPQTQEEK